MTTETPAPACPSCGSTDALRILYGLPTPEAVEASERGELVIGGCLIGGESPDFECRGCGAPLPWVAEREDEDDDD
ncbi:MAG: hypothetical protein ABIW50_07605 [Candidatus Limnocylindria bacterium]